MGIRIRRFLVMIRMRGIEGILARWYANGVFLGGEED
jgi:hypothetical protein